MEKFSQASGISIDDLRIFFSIIAHVPLSFVYRLLPVKTEQDRLIRKIYGFIVAIITHWFCFDLFGNIVFFLSTMLAYWMALQCNENKKTFWISLMTFSSLCVANIIRMIVDYEGNSNNVSLLFMMLAPRMIYFNWTVSRKYGAKLENEIPSYFDYVFFIYSFIGGLTGPVFNYEEHENFIAQTYPEKEINWKLIAVNGLEFVCFTSIFVVSSKVFDFKFIEKPEFKNFNVIFQILFVMLEAFLTRIRYMNAWKLNQIQTIAANIRCSDSKYENYVKTISFKGVELQNSTKIRIDSWNMSIQKWLKNCFYLPSISILNLSPHRASQLTFVVSAFWHGFYPTYYISFFAWNFVSETEKLVFKCKPIYKYFPLIYFRFMLDLNGLLFKRFLMRTWWPIFNNLKYFYAFIFVGYGIMKVIGPRINKQFGTQIEKSVKNEQPKEEQKPNLKKRD